MERVSVGSLADWFRVKNNYNSSALEAIISAIDSEGYGAERDAVLANFSHVRSPRSRSTHELHSPHSSSWNQPSQWHRRISG